MKCSIGANNDLKPIDDEKLRLAAETLKAVAHPVRLRIIEILEKGEKSVTQICAKLGTKQSLTSQQLNRMKTRRQPRLLFYCQPSGNKGNSLHSPVSRRFVRS